MFAPELLKGQVAVVTGGGTGIGLAIARRLGTLGARIVIASRQSENLEHGWHSLRESGIDALAIQLDVRKPEQVDEMVERTVKHFGSLDILVNNAAGNFVCRAEELSPNGWNAVIGIVLNGTFYCSRAVGQYMIARKRGGSIVSILANYVWTGSAGTVHSAAAKAGVMSMTQTLAVEWASHGIRVNAIAPGPIESAGAAKQLWDSDEAVERITKMVPLRRWGKPEEVADTLAFLVSSHAGFITGEILTIDGGAWLGRGTFGFLDGEERSAGTSAGVFRVGRCVPDLGDHLPRYPNHARNDSAVADERDAMDHRGDAPWRLPARARRAPALDARLARHRLSRRHAARARQRRRGVGGTIRAKRAGSRDRGRLAVLDGWRRSVPARWREAHAANDRGARRWLLRHPPARVA